MSTIVTGVFSDKRGCKTRIGSKMPFYIGGSIINFLAIIAYFSNPAYVNQRVDPNNEHSAVARPDL